MINLIENEFVKIFKKKAIWIVGILIIIALLGFNIISKNMMNKVSNYSYYSARIYRIYEREIKSIRL